MTFPPSRVDAFCWKGREWFVKRDDLIDPRFSGNKLRKLYTLLQTDPDRYTTLVSYGGAQSNAMLSLAYLAHLKGWKFIYHIKTMPRWLAQNPTGNLKSALDLGMKLVEIPHMEFYSYVGILRNDLSDDTIFVSQGGAEKIAEEGIRILAEEILSWRDENGIGTCSVATPSGTGTTALYLRRHLPKEIEVLTTPVIGDRDTLLAQWHKLEPDEHLLPKILEYWPKHPFAKPKKRYLDAWRSLKRSGIVFDLVYAPKMWLELLNACEHLKKPILYIHSGGVDGNISQIEKYRYNGLL
jgi:1-aminocyclopropane-1-carboxylate deaminase/D-cysteine desulfhydrase-like pyridoxal-dependent ACC family enzyme